MRAFHLFSLVAFCSCLAVSLRAVESGDAEQTAPPTVPNAIDGAEMILIPGGRFLMGSTDQRADGAQDKKLRARRGGSWANVALHVRCADRQGAPHDDLNIYTGFRCVKIP